MNPDTGKAAYYDENGRSLKRFFLVSPLKFEPRITSRFSRTAAPRHHTMRAHLGVDYAAPHGSAVVAVADGTVVSAGWAGGGGKQVRIRHDRGVETYYLHLSSFARGIRAGARSIRIRSSAGSDRPAPRPDRTSISGSGRTACSSIPSERSGASRRAIPFPAATCRRFARARDGVARQLSNALALAEDAAP